MARDFTPRQFLRQADNLLLQEFCNRREMIGQVDWESLSETDIEPIYQAWQGLADPAQEEIEADLRRIFELADMGSNLAFIEEGHQQGKDLAAELEDVEGFLNKAFYTFLNCPTVFDLVHIWKQTKTLNSRYWRKRHDLPKVEPDTSPATRDDLGRALAVYYRETQGRGRWCVVEHYLLGGRYHYFIAYPKDFTDTFTGYDKQGRFERKAYGPAFEVVFLFDPKDGTLDLYAQGGRKIKEDLQEIFSRVVLKEELGDETKESNPYQLNGLKSREFPFPTDPRDRICDVRVRQLRLLPLGGLKQRITFEATARGEKEEVYDLMERTLGMTDVPLSMYNVDSAVIQMVFDNTGNSGRATKTLSFRISCPDSCNLKDKQEDLIARRCLKDWGLERG